MEQEVIFQKPVGFYIGPLGLVAICRSRSSIFQTGSDGSTLGVSDHRSQMVLLKTHGELPI